MGGRGGHREKEKGQQLGGLVVGRGGGQTPKSSAGEDLGAWRARGS